MGHIYALKKKGRDKMKRLFLMAIFVLGLLFTHLGCPDNGADIGPTYSGGNVYVNNPCLHCDVLSFTSKGHTAIWINNETGNRVLGYLPGGNHRYLLEAKNCISKEGSYFGHYNSGSFLVDDNTQVTLVCDDETGHFWYIIVEPR